ncbi:type II secretion system protein [Sulfurimonas sp.]
MIELVFVIVILGILSAVALPKFIGVSTQAHDAKVKAFIATLNGTVGPALWAKSLADGKDGAIKASCTADLAKNISTPSELVQTGGNACTYGIAPGKGATIGVLTFVDGNATSSPTWAE